MQKYAFFFILLVITVAVCGCTQLSPVQSTPAPTAQTPLPTPSLAITPVSKQVDIAAWKTDKSVIVQVTGGKDTANLVTLRVQIDNIDGTIIKRTLVDPIVGKEYEFTYVGIPNARTVNIIGVFRDGTEQTVLLKYM